MATLKWSKGATFSGGGHGELREPDIIADTQSDPREFCHRISRGQKKTAGGSPVSK